LRRLIYDLEVSPNLALIWRAGYKINVNYDSIVKERAIIVIGWKWHGEKKRHVLTWDKNQDDKAMLLAFSKEMAQADEAVAYFGRSFDHPWLRTRALFHGLILPEVPTVDPLKWARSRFYFNSNKLDYVSKFLGAKGKIETRYDLWKDITLDNCPKALDKMARYCSNDLVLLEFVHDRLRAMSPVSAHAGVAAHGEAWTCPRCGAAKIKQSKRCVTAKGTVQFQMQCKGCAGYYTISNRLRERWMEEREAA
jgi:hypothetical protein